MNTIVSLAFNGYSAPPSNSQSTSLINTKIPARLCHPCNHCPVTTNNSERWMLVVTYTESLSMNSSGRSWIRFSSMYFNKSRNNGCMVALAMGKLTVCFFFLPNSSSKPPLLWQPTVHHRSNRTTGTHVGMYLSSTVTGGAYSCGAAFTLLSMVGKASFRSFRIHTGCQK